jgi:hypothetical protein
LIDFKVSSKILENASKLLGCLANSTEASKVPSNRLRGI